MKKQFITIVFFLAISVLVNAQGQDKQTNVHKIEVAFNALTSRFGLGQDTKDILRNPESNVIEKSIEIIPFSSKQGKDFKQYLDAVVKAFEEDASNAYQIIHTRPNEGVLYSVDNIKVRAEFSNEFMALNFKNSDNPTFRDFYGINWKTDDDGVVNGKVYKITGPRPCLDKKNNLPTFQFNNSVFDKRLSKYRNLLSVYEHSLEKLEAQKMLMMKKEDPKRYKKLIEQINDLRTKCMSLTSRMQTELLKDMEE